MPIEDEVSITMWMFVKAGIVRVEPAAPVKLAVRVPSTRMKIVGIENE